jgi:hypothetical protein
MKTFIMKTFIRWSTTALLCATAASAFFAPLGAQRWKSVTMSRQLSGSEPLAVEVDYGLGSFRLRPSTTGQLYKMQLRYDEEDFQPVATYERGRLHVGVTGDGNHISLRRGSSEARMELELAEGVPMNLDLDLGAVRADVDLGRLSLSGLHLSTGASQTRVDVSRPNPITMRKAEMEAGAAEFTATRLGNLGASEIDVSAGVGKVRLEFTGQWRSDATVDVEVGLGGLELVFPEGLGVRLTRETVLTSFDPEGLTKRGDIYYSPNWDRAERKVTVNVDAAFGSIKVLWTK